MDRRHFLSAGIGFGALAATGSAVADALTYRHFHEALKRDPALAVYADTVGELAGTATIRGRIPADLKGVFYRNGPGRFELGGERYRHWFDGDGFAQRWEIRGGKVSHRGKFVVTRKFEDETAAGQFLYPAFGTHIARRGMKGNDTVNAANTNLVPFNGRVYALWEGGSAVEVDPLTLDTVGYKAWAPQLKSMPFSAHPKIEPDGSMWNFGSMVGTNKLVIYRIGADGALKASRVLDVPNLTMVHDFVMSAHHLIFLVPPFDYVHAAETSFADMHHWAGDGPSARPLRVVVVSKATLEVRRVFEMPPSMVFHFGNAWDDGDITRFDVVLTDGNVLKNLGRLMHGERPPHEEKPSQAALVTLDYRTGSARSTPLLSGSEFPRVMPQVVGARHRKLALVSQSPRSANRVLDTVNLVDIDTGRADSYRFGDGWQVEEHVLVPRAQARSETDGYLVGVAQDTRRGQTVMTVFDAARISDGPMALARVLYRAPHCFHGNYLPA